MLKPLIVIGILSGSTGALAEPVPLADDVLKATVSGTTVEIDTPLGTTVPMRFGADGLVAAEAGVLAPVLGSAKDRGRWWVDGDKLCTKWFRWFDAGVRCLTIARDGTRIYWRKVDDGETGTGTLVAGDESQQQQITVATAEMAARKVPVAEQEKRASRLAVPPRELPAAPDADQRGAAAATTAPDANPVLFAQANGASSADKLDDRPAMRFGGTGLLGVTSPIEAQSVSPSVNSSASAANTSRVAQPFEAKLPAKVPSKDAARGTTAKKEVNQRQASLAAPGPDKRAAEKRSQSGKDRQAVATSSTRSVALYRVRGVAYYDVLNVRRGPSEEHVQIAAIPPTGRRVEITGQCHADWCPIRYGGVTGWVNSYYLAEEGARQDTSSRSAAARP